MEERIKLLYAEDESTVREHYARKLTEEGFDVCAVEDGGKAWECYQNEKWDIILLDMEMPEMDGAEVIRRIRKSGGCVPIVVLSGLNLDDLAVLDEDGGADDFVDKDSTPQTLVTRLNKRLRDSFNRVKKGEQNVLRLSARTIYDRLNCILTTDGKQQKLRPTLAKVMWLLSLRKNEEIPAKELCQRLWGFDSELKKDELSTYISKLRKFLKPDDSVQINRCSNGSYVLITPDE